MAQWSCQHPENSSLNPVIINGFEYLFTTKCIGIEINKSAIYKHSVTKIRTKNWSRWQSCQPLNPNLQSLLFLKNYRLLFNLFWSLKKQINIKIIHLVVMVNWSAFSPSFRRSEFESHRKLLEKDETKQKEVRINPPSIRQCHYSNSRHLPHPITNGRPEAWARPITKHELRLPCFWALPLAVLNSSANQSSIK